MIDIHSHILPEIDDGSKDMEMSIEMAKMYLENGINKVISTPHYIDGIENNCIEENQKILMELRNELQKQNLNIEIYLGNEVLVSLDVLKDLEDKKISTLNGTRYILIELPMFDIPLYVENLIYELLLKGYIPIIAHPERNTKIIENPNIMYKYIKNGALAQMNLPSLEGRYGCKIKETAEILLKHKMIHFVATDAHTCRRRSPDVANAIKILKSIVTQEEFVNLTYKNAANLISDDVIEIDSPIEYKKHKSFFSLIMEKIGMF